MMVFFGGGRDHDSKVLLAMHLVERNFQSFSLLVNAEKSRSNNDVRMQNQFIKYQINAYKRLITKIGFLGKQQKTIKL